MIALPAPADVSCTPQGLPNTADQLRGAHDLALARDDSRPRNGRPGCFHPPPTAPRLLHPLVLPPAALSTHALAPASSHGPDRTPDPLHGARLRDPGGRGTARPFKPERTRQAAPPPVKGRMAGKSGAPPSDRPRAHQGRARPDLNWKGPSAAHTRRTYGVTMLLTSSGAAQPVLPHR